MKNKQNRNIGKIALLVIIAITVLLGILFWYIVKLEKQVAERDALIDELTFSENLVKEYFDIHYDSITNNTSYVLKESKREIVQYVSDNTIFIYGKDTISGNELVRLFNQGSKKYGELISEYNELIIKYNNLAAKDDSINSYNKALQKGLQMIENRYDISLDINNIPNGYEIKLNTSPQIDSAVLLLPHYRDRLERDSARGVWMITNPKLIDEQMSTLQKLFHIVQK